MKQVPVWLWAVLVAIAGFSIWSYGNGRAATALAEARRDSLATAAKQHAELELSRDSARVALATAVVAWDVERESLDTRAVQAETASEANLGALAAALADTSSPVPDTIRVLVGAAIEGLEDERDVCRAQLVTCDETRILLETRIAIDSSSILEKDTLLVAYKDQLDDAIADRSKPAGVIRWTERALAAYGLVELVLRVVGRGGGP